VVRLGGGRNGESEESIAQKRVHSGRWTVDRKGP
jgi:hypothetical protein